MPVACDDEFLRVMEWVAACAVLHHICIRLGDTYAIVESANSRIS